MFLLISFVGSVDVLWSSMRLCVCFVKMDFFFAGLQNDLDMKRYD